MKPVSSTIAQRNIKKYKRWTDGQLKVLENIYKTEKYPSSKEMKKLSISFGVTLRKIDNWFKHKRRTDVKKGNMDFSRKKSFSKSDNSLLLKEFKLDPYPTYNKTKELAERLKCEIKNIQNWFSYQRKLAQRLKKAQIKLPNENNEIHFKSEVSEEDKKNNLINEEINKIMTISSNVLFQNFPLNFLSPTSIDMINHEKMFVLYMNSCMDQFMKNMN